MKFNNLTKMNSYSAEVKDVVFNYYSSLGLSPAEIFDAIESNRTYVGQLNLLWLKYPNRYTITADIDDEAEITAENLRWKDYKLIWLEPDVIDGMRKVVAEILTKEK